jgi:hypothetical protein
MTFMKKKPDKLKSSYDKACREALTAIKGGGKLPRGPMILLGSEGFYFGPESDEDKGAVSVSGYVDEYECEADEVTQDDVTPPYEEVIEHLSSFFEENDKRTWQGALKLARKGQFTEIMPGADGTDAPSLDTRKKRSKSTSGATTKRGK